jgi:hypothetical protein
MLSIGKCISLLGLALTKINEMNFCANFGRDYGT